MRRCVTTTWSWKHNCWIWRTFIVRATICCRLELLLLPAVLYDELGWGYENFLKETIPEKVKLQRQIAFYVKYILR